MTYHTIIVFALCWSFLSCAHAATDGLVDLTKTTPAQTDNSYNLGPTGALGWMYVEKAMTEKSRQILITVVEKGSPAEGKLEVGDVILGVFGKPFADDARRVFGQAIGQAETEKAGGKLPMIVWRKGKSQTVELTLQIMGTYSDTSPYLCPKSKKILDQGLPLVIKNFSKENSLHVNELALLASGRPEHFDVVRKSAQELASKTPDVETLWKNSSDGRMATWHHGYHTIFLCEYFLATGDSTVLPAIRSYATTISRGQGHFGTWGHGYVPPTSTGELHGPVPPYGPVNMTGLPCFISLILAEKCGIDVPELKPAIARSNRFFSYYAGKGSIPYGEHRPGAVHDDNGKSSLAAMAFSLQEKHTESVFFTKMVTASFESREWGHTGNGFSYLWGPIAANCGGPKAMSAFMKELRWYYDLARRWDGAFVNIEIGGGVASSYHRTMEMTACYLLGYAAPLKKILLTGHDAKPELWLSDKDITEAVASGRWLGEQAFAKRTTARLLADLASWSPQDRAWSAEELGKRKDDIIPQLIALTKSRNLPARLGAVNALGQLRSRAVPALNTLAALLNDDDRWLRVQAAEALRNIGQDSKPVLPQMLTAAVLNDETDPMQFGVGALAYALFYPGGSYGPKGILADSVEKIEKEQLYAVIRSIAENPDSAARGCLRSTYALLTIDDVKVLAPQMFASINNMAPANTMFSKGIRLAGIEAMARLRIEEGIPLTMMMMKLPDWGKAYIISVSLKVLKQYRGAAKSIIPELKKIAAEPKKSAADREAIEKVIAIIEQDNDPPKLVSIKDYLDQKTTPKSPEKPW